MRTLEQKRAALNDLRSKWKSLWDSKPNQDFTRSEVDQLKTWNDEMRDLVDEIQQAEQIDAILKDQHGGGGERPIIPGDTTGGAWLPSTSAPRGTGSFAGAILGAGFDLKSRPSVTVPLAAAIERKDIDLSSTTPATYSVRQVGAIADLGYDRRYLWPYLQRESVGDETAISDFRQTGSRTITGSVERAIAATTEKATLDVALDAVTEQLKTLAVLIDNIPNQVLRSVAGIADFFNTEARYVIDNALDAHVAAQILAATPPNGESGADIFAQVRNAMTAMRANGYSPDLLVLDGADSAALDLLQDNEARFYYGLDGRGDTATVFGVRIIERTAGAAFDPLLIDSQRIGKLYLGTLRVDADPFTGFSTNQTDIRMEMNALMHVRAANAAYRIAAA